MHRIIPTEANLPARPASARRSLTLAKLRLLAACLGGSMADAAPPSVLYSRVPREIVRDTPAVLWVAVDGTPPFAFQWWKNGGVIPGATNDLLVIRHAEYSETGWYSVIVSTLEGSDSTASEELTVGPQEAGDVDGSFQAAEGTPRYPYGGPYAIDATGKLLIGPDLIRLNADGTIDTDFHRMPEVTITAIALQRDGKILVAGSEGGPGPFTGKTHAGFPVWNFLRRLNSDGSVDSSFVGFGKNVASDIDPLWNGSVWQIATQPDGKAIAFGAFERPDRPPVILLRFRRDGTVDPEFSMPSRPRRLARDTARSSIPALG